MISKVKPEGILLYHHLHCVALLCTYALSWSLTSQNLSRNIEHWMDGILMLSDCLTTGRDVVHSSLLEFIITSLKEKVTNNVTTDCGIAILTHRYVHRHTLVFV